MKKTDNTNFTLEISSINKKMEAYLKSSARNEYISSQPIYLRTQYKNTLKLYDSQQRQFTVQESYLNAFMQIYTNKEYKYVRLNSWQLQIGFIGKRCLSIALISDSVVFIANNQKKQEIYACHFKLFIVQDQSQIQKLPPETLGYLNRLGKRHLCSLSLRIAKEMKSLIYFIPKKQIKQQKFQYLPWKPHEVENINPLQAINENGKQVLHKLTHFITRAQIQNFIIESQLSEEVIHQLKKLLSERNHQ